MENALTVHSLITKYLAWCGKHRSPRTLEWYESHLKNFLAHLGDAKGSPAADLKPYHVIEWIDAQTGWGDNYSRGAIVAVQRAYNWGEEMGHLAATPLKKIKKPLAKRRETFMTPEDFEAILVLLAGWVVCLGPHTISGVWQATGWAARRHHDTAYAVFRSAV